MTMHWCPHFSSMVESSTLITYRNSQGEEQEIVQCECGQTHKLVAWELPDRPLERTSHEG